MGYDTLRFPVFIKDVQHYDGVNPFAYDGYEVDTLDELRPDLTAMILHDGLLWIAHVDANPDTDAVEGPFVETYDPAGDTWGNVGGTIEALAVSAASEGDRYRPARVALASDGTDVFLAYTISQYHDGGEGDFGDHGYFRVVVRKWTGSSWALLLDEQVNRQSRGTNAGSLISTHVALAARDGVAHLLVSRSDPDPATSGLRYLSTAGDDVLLATSAEAQEFANFFIKADAATVYAFFNMRRDPTDASLLDLVMWDCAALIDVQRIGADFFANERATAKNLAISGPYDNGDRQVYYQLVFDSNTGYSALLQVPIDGSGPWEHLDGDAGNSGTFVHDQGSTPETGWSAGQRAFILPEPLNVWVTWEYLYQPSFSVPAYAVRCENFDRRCAPHRWRNQTPRFWSGENTTRNGIPPNTLFEFSDSFNRVNGPSPAVLIGDAIYQLVLWVPASTRWTARLQLWRWDICRGCGACESARGLHVWQRF